MARAPTRDAEAAKQSAPGEATMTIVYDRIGGAFQHAGSPPRTSSGGSSPDACGCVSDREVAAITRRAVLTYGTLLAASGGAVALRLRQTSRGVGRLGIEPATSASGPLRVSGENPRYFADPRGHVAYLTGSHTWDNFQDWGSPTPPFDYDAYLDLLELHGHNFIRLWTWEQPGIEAPQRPQASVNPLPFLRTGPGFANDGKPRFDLTRLNPQYFDRLRARLVAAGERGIYGSVMLFQEYLHWSSHPFNSANNINGIDGDTNRDGDGGEIHTLANPDVLALQYAYIRHVIDAVNDLDNVLYEIGNELKRDTLEWQSALARYIKAYQARLPKQHPIGITATGGCARPESCTTNEDLFGSPADWISPYVAPGQDYANDPPEAQGSKVIISDTDHIWPVVTAPTVEWVWKSFLRGLNPIVMDVVQHSLPGHAAEWNDPTHPRYPAVRKAMGHTRAFASRLALNRTVPASQLASTRYCLAEPGSRYLVYVPAPLGRRATLRHWLYRTPISVDLSGASGPFVTEWFYPGSNTTVSSDDTIAGGVRQFSPPLTGDAVLFFYRRAGGSADRSCNRIT